MRGMSLIVKTITNVMIGFIFIFGIYIILHGHLTPGGGFAGGVILAGAFILRLLAFGSDAGAEKKSEKRSSVFESLGGLMFIGIAIAGLIVAQIFFLNFLPKGTPLHLLSAGIIPLCNIAISIKVGAGLFSIFLALAAVKYVMED
ncbi:cation:proton antiporter [candidate division WOR-3 bacterium]|nr:cation:proton antiporter [candidate division WOR-3 bacterium]